ncbi:HIT family protein [Rhodococcus sp. RS1C4]|uniref:HIT family protein n=1 Tax=Rhodococcus sp. 114MFTsu3.1 TaxID=1172184 RepID=UPI0009DB99D3|nr:MULTISPECIES: HIT family protein [unclassified Rhodococcus (in: high G+C Gram-positive bacteria)]OZC48466.1 HIT family protein [Rhodococcus sp. RS1C4]
MILKPGCDFCEIVVKDEPARVVFRTNDVVAFFPTNPATLGHTLVIPTSHFADIWELDESNATRLTSATLKVARAIRSGLSPDGLNIIQSNGSAATQSVFHLHVHIVPRWADDAMGRIWPTETHWSEDAKNACLTVVRTSLTNLS